MEGNTRLVFSAAAEAAQAGDAAVLATVVRVRGSAPQVVGAKLLLRPDGRFVGTIGGGAVEAAVLREGARMAVDGQPAQLRVYQLAAELGMCCGGVMEIFLEPVRAESFPHFAMARDLENAGTRGASAFVIRTSEGGIPIGAKLIVSASGEVVHELRDDPLRPAIERDTRSLAQGGEAHIGSYIAPGGHEVEVFLEPLRATPRLLLFGAGHVAQPLAHVASMLGFRVVVIDDRPDWASLERFPSADEIVHLPHEDFLFDLEHRPSDYILIVTRGHDFDQQILESVIDKEYSYLGMIGSRSKVKRAFLRLESAGVLPQLLAKVRAPIGLNIGAETPEEIAVAVGAELVLERRGGAAGRASIPSWWRDRP